jgi:hypothetical protein
MEMNTTVAVSAKIPSLLSGRFSRSRNAGYFAHRLHLIDEGVPLTHVRSHGFMQINGLSNAYTSKKGGDLKVAGGWRLVSVQEMYYLLVYNLRFSRSWYRQKKKKKKKKFQISVQANCQTIPSFILGCLRLC